MAFIVSFLVAFGRTSKQLNGLEYFSFGDTEHLGRFNFRFELSIVIW